MIFYTTYKTNTGEILFTGNALNEEDVINIVSDEQSYILEQSKENQYILNGKIIDMPAKPGDDYVFDYNVKQWVFDEQMAINKTSYKRDQLLAEGPDRISPIWYNAMTNEQREAWAQYRQDLLDITQQPNYPRDIIWPIKPTEGA